MILYPLLILSSSKFGKNNNRFLDNYIAKLYLFLAFSTPLGRGIQDLKVDAILFLNPRGQVLNAS
jgi:hypothetical protein